MLLLFCMKMEFVLTLSTVFFFLSSNAQLSCSLSPPLLGWHYNQIFRWCRKCFISIHSHCPLLSMLRRHWTVLILLFSCDMTLTLYVVFPSLCPPTLPPQYFIHLCPRLSFRVLRQGLLRSLSLPKRCRLRPHHRSVCLPNGLHWDELWAELSRTSTF